MEVDGLLPRGLTHFPANLDVSLVVRATTKGKVAWLLRMVLRHPRILFLWLQAANENKSTCQEGCFIVSAHSSVYPMLPWVPRRFTPFVHQYNCLHARCPSACLMS